MLERKNFIFNLKAIGNTNFKIKNSNSDIINIGENQVSNVKLIKQEKAETHNYKIYVNDNEAFIMDIIKDSDTVYNNYENDIDCALYNLEYKKELTKIIDSNYKSVDELPEQNLSPSYNEDTIGTYLEKKNIEISNKSNYCPIDKPFPYDTIEQSVSIKDKDNIDFKIKYNNKCCSDIPEFDIMSENQLIDEITGEILTGIELDKLKKYINIKNIKLHNICSDSSEDLERDKRQSFLNLKENQKVLLNGNSITKIKELDTIITDFGDDLSHYINQRTLFEIIPVYDSVGVEIEGMTEFTYSTLVSKNGKGTK